MLLYIGPSHSVPSDCGLPRKAFADLCGVTVRATEMWAKAGKGPPRDKIGGRVTYKSGPALEYAQKYKEGQI